MLVGPVGTGKTSVAEDVLNRLDPAKYSLLVLNMSAQVSGLIELSSCELMYGKLSRAIEVDAYVFSFQLNIIFIQKNFDFNADIFNEILLYFTISIVWMWRKSSISN